MKCQEQEQRQQDLTSEVQTLRQQKADLDNLLKQQKQQQQQQQAQVPSSRRQGSPVTPGGIPPSDSTDSGLPASGANSDEGWLREGKGGGGGRRGWEGVGGFSEWFVGRFRCRSM